MIGPLAKGPRGRGPIPGDALGHLARVGERWRSKPGVASGRAPRALWIILFAGLCVALTALSLKLVGGLLSP